jgi:hypothetical protein
MSPAEFAKKYLDLEVCMYPLETDASGGPGPAMFPKKAGDPFLKQGYG